MKFASLAAVAALGVVVSGCASIVEGTTQSIAITTSPQPGEVHAQEFRGHLVRHDAG
jgi:hypothetical protein